MTRRAWLVAALVPSALLVGGCNGEHAVDWRYYFEDPATEARAQTMIAEVRSGGCDGIVRFSTSFAPDGSGAEAPPPLAEGTYGFAIEARDADCNVVARGCIDRAVPGNGGTAFVPLRTSDPPRPACAPGVECADGLCEGEMRVDGGPPQDGGPDGAPPFDGGDCAGCWDATGTCVTGDAPSACGAGGVACSDCSCTGDVCGAAGCVPAVAFEQVAVAERHACALSAGHAYCWGTSAVGEIGTGGFDDASSGPVPVGVVDDYEELATHGRHTCARRSSGEIHCWGSNNYGQIGDETMSTGRFSPTTAAIDDVAQVAVGYWFTLVRKTDGSVWGFGRSSEGQLLNDPSTDQYLAPVRLGADTGYTDMAAGTAHTCLLQDGRVLCAGRSERGAFGPAMGNVATLVDLGVRTDFVDVEAGHQNTCARTGDGATYCTGCNSAECEGALGFGVAADVFGLERLPDDGLSQVSLWHHMCALTETGALSCSGPNADGRLGVGDTDARTRLTPVLPGAHWMAVAAGHHSTCAVRSTGELYCWGSNEHLVLGSASAAPDAVVTSPTRACPE